MLQYIKGLLTKQTDLAATDDENEDSDVDVQLLEIVERQNTLIEVFEDAAVQYKGALNTTLRVLGAYLMQNGTQEVVVDEAFINIMFNKHMTANILKNENGETVLKIVSALPNQQSCGAGGCEQCDCDSGEGDS